MTWFVTLILSFSWKLGVGYRTQSGCECKRKESKNLEERMAGVPSSGFIFGLNETSSLMFLSCFCSIIPLVTKVLDFCLVDATCLPCVLFLLQITCGASWPLKRPLEAQRWAIYWGKPWCLLQVGEKIISVPRDHWILLNYPFWVDETMQIDGNLKGSSFKSALFGLVI